MASENAVLVVGKSGSDIRTMLPYARAFAQEHENDLTVLGVVQVAKQESLSVGALCARRLRKAISHLPLANAEVTVRVAHDPWAEVSKTIADRKPELVLVHHTNLPTCEWIDSLPCNLAVIKPPLPRKHLRILLPIRGGPYAALSLRLARALAQERAGDITVLHASISSDDDRPYHAFLRRLTRLPEVKDVVDIQGGAADAIVRAAADYDLIVMGASAYISPTDSPVGTTAQSILDCADLSAVIVRSARPSFPPAMPEVGRQPVDYTISVIVDKWFAENTFHATEFEDLGKLVELKERQKLTISLGLPTLNEEKTIGKILQLIRRRFIDEFPLLDEVVVIDSNSTDRTVEIAQKMGVPVVRHPEVLTQYEKWRGKGEALWNSLYILRGDLIAWIDTDIINIHPRFVYGILGPLIREPRLVYVKGFYQRPIKTGGKMEARGGGRVTELTARPLINLFYPELSGFVQPLSGEYAGRREALESVPFFAGYGVETGLLIDIWHKFGLDRIGQVDLEERIHRNQSITALSKMAFEIIQVFMLRIGQSRGTELVDELNKSMKLIRYEQNEFELDVADIRARERPPMITVPEYRERRGIGKLGL